MASRIQGITVEIGGDTTKLSKALENVNKTIRSTQTQLKDVEKLLKLDPSNTELLSQKHKLLADAVTATKEKLDTLKTAANQAADALARGGINQEQYDALQREIVETEQELQRLQQEAAKSASAFEKIGAAGEKLQAAGDKVAGVGQKLLPVTAGVSALGTAAVKTASDFDSAMSKVAAVSGATGDDFQSLRDKAREMGAKTKFSATEAAEAMNYMAMAGWKTQNMLSGIEGIMNLAAASGEELATTSDIVTDALTAFGLTAADSGHFADVLAAASSNANTNVSMMGETFKYCAPIAGSMGFSCESTAQAIGLMANSGIKSTQAGTSLRSIMTALAGEVKLSGAAFGKMQIATTNTDGSMRELNDILADCRSAFAQMSESEQASAAKTLVGKNAMSGFLALMNAAPADIAKLQGAIETCDGTSLRMAETMQDNLGGQVTILKSQLQELAISFGDILMPAIRGIVAKVQGLTDKLNGLTDAQKETIAKIALVVAALGPALIVIGKTISTVGGLMRVIGNLPKYAQAAKAAFVAIKGAIAGVSLPVVAVVAAIAVLVAAFVHLWKTNEDFRNNITAIWNQIKSIFQNFCQGIVERINALGFDFANVGEVIKAVWEGLCKFLKPIFEGVFQQIANIFKLVTNTILSILDIFVGIFTGDWDRVWEGIKGIFVGVWDFLKATFQNYLNVLQNLCGGALEKIKAVVLKALTATKNFFVGIWTSIATFVHNVLTGIQAFFTTVWTAIRDVFVGVWTAIVNNITERIELIRFILTTVWNAISGFLAGVMDTIRSILTAVWDGIVAHITEVLDTIHSVVSTVWNAISDMISGVLHGIFTTISTVWNRVKATITSVMNAIRTTITGIWNSVKSAVGSVIDGIKDTIVEGFTKAIDFIKNLASEAWNWGADIINGIVDGIKSCMHKVTDAVTGVADKIRGFLHFSVPDEGPLTDFESWMPDFMQGLAKGINRSKGMVTKALAGVTQAMQLTMTSDLHISLDGLSGAMLSAGKASIPATTVNNYIQNDNSRTVHQTNHSPKALSRLEIYRLTRNAVKE